MRTLMLVLLAAGPVAAQSSPAVAEIAVESVPVRCGPSDQMPDTGVLFRGTQVVVDHDEANGWVAIEPPRGQVSWVKHLNLDAPTDVIPRNATLHADPDVAIAFGKPGLGKPLDVERTRLPDGTAVMVIGKKVENRGTYWYPIEPPAGDFRYVPKSAVRVVAGKASQAFVVKSPKPVVEVPASADTVPVAAAIRPVAAKGADWPNHPLWTQADQAERAGEYAQAETLYLRLAAEMNRPGGDSELANLCYTRVHAVREKQRQGGAPKDAKGTPAWVGPGSLRPAGFKIDNRVTFALVGRSGQVKCYAVAGPNVELERYSGYAVELYGPVSYPGDLRGVGVVTATGVKMNRDK